MEAQHLILLCLTLAGLGSGFQDDVDYLARNLDIRYQVLSNFEDDSYGYPKTVGELLITNTGDEDVIGVAWEIYFNSGRLFEQDVLLTDPQEGAPLGSSGLYVYHVSGSLHMISPGPEFGGFVRSRTIYAPFNTTSWTVARSDVSPNWYVTWYDAEPKLIQSTESLDMVVPFDREEKWKRRVFDEYNPYSPEERYERNDGTNFTAPLIPVIPTPAEYDRNWEAESFNLTEGEWTIYVEDEEALDAAWFLSERLDLNITFRENSTYDSNSSADGVIGLFLGDVYDMNGTVILRDEAYSITPEEFDNAINIVGTDRAGLLHGVQSLLSLYNRGPTVPQVTITDYPRFGYRGLMVDVARNFLPKESVLKLLDAMSMYKLNKFHFHLTDDEGWRLEIPGLEELTEIGAQRCHDLSRTECVGPQLGSGPYNSTSGSGFYTVEDYRQILSFAESRNIEVIPEFDMPGHSHAAILAMEARYETYMDVDMSLATEYLLSDLNDSSVYISPQLYRDNAVNPCMESTYRFIRKLVSEVKAMHDGAQDLAVLNFGGNMAPEGAWVDSPECDIFGMDPDQIKKMFVYRVAEILDVEDLKLGGWEDSFLDPDDVAYNLTSLPQDEVYAYAWNNVWENGEGSRAYNLANEGYKVVLSHASHLFFDVAHEPDPEESGSYWGSRYTETWDTYGYMPDSVYDNIDVDLFGRPLDREQLCDEVGCEELMPGREDNIVGIQGQLWSESVRGERAAEYMLFPRLLALAERAWHRAAWEDVRDDEEERAMQRDDDWEYFANTLGVKELRRLDRMDVDYRIPTPGARGSVDAVLEVNVDLPGLLLQYSTDKGSKWTPIIPGTRFSPNQELLVRTMSADLSRTSREVSVRMPAKSLKNSLTETVEHILSPFVPGTKHHPSANQQPQRHHQSQRPRLSIHEQQQLKVDQLREQTWEYNAANSMTSLALVPLVVAVCTLLAM